MSNLTSARANLRIKRHALKNAQATLAFFKRSSNANSELIKETQCIIEQLRLQIIDIEKEVSELQKRAKKKS